MTRPVMIVVMSLVNKTRRIGVQLGKFDLLSDRFSSIIHASTSVDQPLKCQAPLASAGKAHNGIDKVGFDPFCFTNNFNDSGHKFPALMLSVKPISSVNTRAIPVG